MKQTISIITKKRNVLQLQSPLKAKHYLVCFITWNKYLNVILCWSIVIQLWCVESTTEKFTMSEGEKTKRCVHNHRCADHTKTCSKSVHGVCGWWREMVNCVVELEGVNISLLHLWRTPNRRSLRLSALNVLFGTEVMIDETLKPNKTIKTSCRSTSVDHFSWSQTVVCVCMCLCVCVSVSSCVC